MESMICIESYLLTPHECKTGRVSKYYIKIRYKINNNHFKAF